MSAPTHPYSPKLQRALSVLTVIEAQDRRQSGPVVEFKMPRAEYEVLLELVRAGATMLGREWLDGGS